MSLPAGLDPLEDPRQMTWYIEWTWTPGNGCSAPSLMVVRLGFLPHSPPAKLKQSHYADNRTSPLTDQVKGLCVWARFSVPQARSHLLSCKSRLYSRPASMPAHSHTLCKRTFS